MNENLLLFSIFFPRISLWWAWCSGVIPINTVPFWAEVAVTVFVPRFLIVFYIATTMGTSNEWFWAHLILAILSVAATGRSSTSRRD